MIEEMRGKTSTLFSVFQGSRKKRGVCVGGESTRNFVKSKEKNVRKLPDAVFALKLQNKILISKWIQIVYLRHVENGDKQTSIW